MPPRPVSSYTFSSTSSSSSSLRRGVLTRDFSFDDIIVPKNRRPRFDLFIEIHDLNNVPLVSGQAYVKWHLQGSNRAEARGRTTKETIKDHKVAWHFTHTCEEIRMTIGRNGMLQEQLLIFEVCQEYAGARERIALGTVQLNLAEYTQVHRDTRRYLMQDSKINSTLKITVALTQVGGDENFIAPQLQGAQVFGGIAGIIGEARDVEDPGHRSISRFQKRDRSAIHDMYRSTLAASWQLQAGELNPEECIDDIFAGGDGWTPRSERFRGKPKSVRYEGGLSRGGMDGSDSDSLSAVSSGGGNSTTGNTHLGTSDLRRKRDGDTLSIVSFAIPPTERRTSGRSSIRSTKSEREVDEVRAREDLVSWKMPAVSR
ncbi:hypothetical protein P167DRAFT_551971 [Morchella conica CCBAS932]|uniref:C2 NT-type domain-containing protein n=1 Tax=Morchella conica CCBAS932 TaxID=1392247 RepID=A0A3N4L1D9_9PEZI|nr:hypothetical protein P167DRAFT_551971 [Morchella conica CCBAS932]